MSIVWIGLTALITAFICGVAGYVLLRRKTGHIRALQLQAENVLGPNLDQPLIPASDDVEGLASAFNDMRDRLQAATISRNYVDSLLSGMNEAIIVTSLDGLITRVNKATTHLLGYEEAELIGTSIDRIVDRNKSGTLIDDVPSGMPKETMFESKFRESIPVSYTC